ncbi:hypothetical protein [Lichenicoccus sp.]|uniref:hypothetical protein n=1 Tax=Lichenicoccus sp. TaxID=2781899 RepID=UPI003D09FA4E
MPDTMTADLSHDDLMAIRDAVPGLDLLGIRSLSRAGYRIVRDETAAGRASSASTAADHLDS